MKRNFDKVKIISTVVTIVGFITTMASDWVADKELDRKISEISKKTAKEIMRKES